MHVLSGSKTSPLTGRRTGTWWLALACLWWQVAALAQDDATSGEFSIRSAYSQALEGVYHVSAQIDYGLTDTAVQALNSGVALTFNVDIDVKRERRFLPDKSEHQLQQRYELAFDSLTERYVVRSLNSGEQKTYNTLSGALRQLGDIDRLPVIDAALLDAERDYSIAIRASLDTRSFQGVLRFLASVLSFGDWRLTSGWHAWALNP